MPEVTQMALLQTNFGLGLATIFAGFVGNVVYAQYSNRVREKGLQSTLATGAVPDIESEVDLVERQGATQAIKSILKPQRNEEWSHSGARFGQCEPVRARQSQTSKGSTGYVKSPRRSHKSILVKVVTVSNESPDLIPVIALFCEHDPRVARAWVCHPGTKHVGKQIRGEGGFCWYRNIQMVVSYIQSAYPRGFHPFEGRIPTILRLQDWIEEGWDKGVNSSARLETSGIKGTRKYIGTSGTAFYDWCKRPLPSIASLDQKASKPGRNSLTGSKTTSRWWYPPGSRPVGCETNRDGSKNLLVFDPFFTPPAPMKDPIGARSLSRRMDPELLLRACRRRMNYLQKYKEFEVITLDS
ncbi:peptidase family C78-domain-containing protein [Tuber borchii]|uniref:Peptidase family C78-domain-containing protein n=1 Tax=Tuber borchii TaxID=42251 RepID=A0A2T6ZX64_TUBBO|nr:peptidase family C78-domain-containing protein [Tuber borchii]